MKLSLFYCLFCKLTSIYSKVSFFCMFPAQWRSYHTLTIIRTTRITWLDFLSQLTIFWPFLLLFFSRSFLLMFILPWVLGCSVIHRCYYLWWNLDFFLNITLCLLCIKPNALLSLESLNLLEIKILNWFRNL